MKDKCDTTVMELIQLTGDGGEEERRNVENSDRLLKDKQINDKGAVPVTKSR